MQIGIVSIYVFNLCGISFNPWKLIAITEYRIEYGISLFANLDLYVILENLHVNL